MAELKKQLLNKETGEIKTVVYSTAENPVYLKSAFYGKKLNLYEKRHLVRDGKSVKIVSDGILDIDEEIQSELKNAGLQNILKLQEMRYGTLDNAIARANDRGVYCDVSKIPDSVGERAEYIDKARQEINRLKTELGLSDDDLNGLTAERLAELYQAKQNPPQTGNTEGGAE